MKTDNEIIAEFMGFKFDGLYFCKRKEVYRKEELLYGNSWSWLMQVVEKIMELIDKKHYPHGIGGGITVVAKIYDLPIHAPIKRVYKAVIEFIKWYNSTELKQL